MTAGWRTGGRSIAAGILVVVVVTLRGVITGVSWDHALVDAIAPGVGAAVALAVSELWQRWSDLDALGSARAHLRRAAVAALRAGPLPSEPDVREAARRVAVARLAQVNRSSGYVVMGLLLLACLVAGLVSSLWWLLVAAMFAATIVAQRRVAHRLQRRLALLEGGGAPATARRG